MHYTHHNSKFRLSENILGPYLKVTQSSINSGILIRDWYIDVDGLDRDSLDVDGAGEKLGYLLSRIWGNE